MIVFRLAADGVSVEMARGSRRAAARHSVTSMAHRRSGLDPTRRPLADEATSSSTCDTAFRALVAIDGVDTPSVRARRSRGRRSQEAQVRSASSRGAGRVDATITGPRAVGASARGRWSAAYQENARRTLVPPRRGDGHETKGGGGTDRSIDRLSLRESQFHGATRSAVGGWRRRTNDHGSPTAAARRLAAIRS